MLELKHLRYLIAVSEETTFVGAAERLHLAQPALSRQIHKFEKRSELPFSSAGARRSDSLLPARFVSRPRAASSKEWSEPLRRSHGRRRSRRHRAGICLQVGNLERIPPASWDFSAAKEPSIPSDDQGRRHRGPLGRLQHDEVGRHHRKQARGSLQICIARYCSKTS